MYYVHIIRDAYKNVTLLYIYNLKEAYRGITWENVDGYNEDYRLWTNVPRERYRKYEWNNSIRNASKIIKTAKAL